MCTDKARSRWFLQCLVSLRREVQQSLPQFSEMVEKVGRETLVKVEEEFPDNAFLQFATDDTCVDYLADKLSPPYQPVSRSEFGERLLDSVVKNAFVGFHYHQLR